MKTLQLSEEELTTLIGLIRDGMILRRFQKNLEETPDERFLLNYTSALAGYGPIPMTEKLQERLGATTG